MTRRFLLAAVGVIGLAVPMVAVAGASWRQQVVINDFGGGWRGASGHLQAARDAPGGQYIGCSASPGGGMCFASDGLGQSVYCYYDHRQNYYGTMVAGGLPLIATIGPHSYVSFTVGADSGRCYNVEIDNGSFGL
jgi:hypothetical protein